MLKLCVYWALALSPIDGMTQNMDPVYVKLHFERSCTPTLQMARTCLKRRLFDDKNDVHWMGFRLGLRAQPGRDLALEPKQTEPQWPETTTSNRQILLLEAFGLRFHLL